jgi:transmembrane sensor
MKEDNHNGRFTDKEWEEIASFLSDENNENTEIINQFKIEDIYNTENNWKELIKMNREEINVDEAWNKVCDRLKGDGIDFETKQIGTSFLRNSYFRVAAAIFVILSLAGVIVLMNNSGHFNRSISYSTNSDQKNLKIDLPDGSKVFLNRNSTLSYNKAFGRPDRNVKLSGEAFFDIARDTNNPFVIDAGLADIKVLGTSFNVKTANNQSQVEVYVKSGKVLLSDNSNNDTVSLTPGFVGTIGNNKHNRTINKDPNYLSWNTGFLVYEGQKLEVVFNDLKKVYNIDINTNSNEILDYTWTTSPIDNEPMDTIIKLICTSFNLDYKKEGKTYYLVKK